MQIQKSGKANDTFLDELKRLMPVKAEAKSETPKEEQLEKDRDEKKQEAETDLMEVQLDSDRKDDPKDETFEGQLEKNRKESKAAAPNVDKEGITEQRLNEASKETYPHRNPKAHERTGEKRPINALREEMGNASDEAKRERHDKAMSAQKAEKSILDEDVGSQMTNKKAFNLKGKKTAALEACKDYLMYKNAEAEKQSRFAEVEELDVVMSGIMEKGQKEALNQDDLAKIAALKIRKSELLKVAMWPLGNSPQIDPLTTVHNAAGEVLRMVERVIPFLKYHWQKSGLNDSGMRVFQQINQAAGNLVGKQVSRDGLAQFSNFVKSEALRQVDTELRTMPEGSETKAQLQNLMKAMNNFVGKADGYFKSAPKTDAGPTV